VRQQRQITTHLGRCDPPKRVVQRQVLDTLHVLGDGGREQQRLSLGTGGRQSAEDDGEVRRHRRVQHSIRFVEHDEPHQ
jgi:hypothetical protein